MVAFSRELQNDKLLSLIQRGQVEAMAEHGGVAATWAGPGVDWGGGRLLVPPATAVGALVDRA